MNKLRACFASVIMSLQGEGEERGDAKALGLQAMLSEYRFIATMLLMCDALIATCGTYVKMFSAN